MEPQEASFARLATKSAEGAKDDFQEPRLLLQVAADQAWPGLEQTVAPAAVLVEGSYADLAVLPLLPPRVVR